MKLGSHTRCFWIVTAWSHIDQLEKEELQLLGGFSSGFLCITLSEALFLMQPHCFCCHKKRRVSCIYGQFTALCFGFEWHDASWLPVRVKMVLATFCHMMWTNANKTVSCPQQVIRYVDSCRAVHHGWVEFGLTAGETRPCLTDRSACLSCDCIRTM